MEITVTFHEELEQTGQMYLSDVIRQQIESYELEEDDAKPEAPVEEDKKFIHTILDVISKHNPFKK